MYSVNQILQYGEVKRGRIGVAIQDTLEELRYLVTQCQDLTDLLAAWNDVIDPDVPIVLADDTKTLKRVFSFLKKKPSQPINH